MGASRAERVGDRRKRMGRRLSAKLLQEDALQGKRSDYSWDCLAWLHDSKASWSLNRRIDQRCGKTLQDTLRVFAENNDADHPMPFVMIATWNDYEEGTAIENGLARCDRSPPKAEDKSIHAKK